MFTGLVESIGHITTVARTPKGSTFTIQCTLAPYTLGESIAVHGACLTVMRFSDTHFSAEASLETLDKTILGSLHSGAPVHLERALALGERLGGHLVTGHVDGIGTLAKREPLGDATRLTFQAPSALRAFLAPKGSITINGVSLTVNGATDTHFDVALVPFTQSETTFGALAVNSPVNLEVDILAKYIARLLGRPGVDVGSVNAEGTHSKDTLSEAFLTRHGFA